MPRPMTAADLDRVLEINEANVPEVGSLDRDRLHHLFAQATIALVETGATEPSAEIVGFCLVFAADADYDSENFLWFVERDPSTMYLDRVAFDASAIGRGLGTAMYDEVARVLAERHPAASTWTLEVNVDPPNERSLAFHRGLGFVEVGRRMSKGIEVSLMERQLDGS
ncbi:MAG: GNAT family N-acetyltransferase [Ilumatobacter sp.]